MDRLATYALVAAIGEITKPTREERNREGDRWVALRSLDREPVSLAKDVECQGAMGVVLNILRVKLGKKAKA